jgi:imidazolonepropionase-like amidohydrolase
MDLLNDGITTIRVVGGPNYVDLSLKEAITMGHLPGPRIFGAGVGVGPTGGHGSWGRGRSDREVNGPAAFLAATRERLKAGVDLIKIMISGGLAGERYGPEVGEMLPEEVRAVTDAAHRAGKPVTAHAGGGPAIIEAVHAGLDCVEHGYLLNDEAAELMAERGIYYVPTLNVTLDENRAVLWKWHKWKAERARNMAPGHLAGFQAAMRAGVKIGCGTDRPQCLDYRTEYLQGKEGGYPVIVPCPAPGTVVEMETMRKAGLSPMATLQSATKIAAEICQAQDKLGTLEAGKLADMVAVKGNPLEDVSCLRHIGFVMKGGEVIRNSIQAG